MDNAKKDDVTQLLNRINDGSNTAAGKLRELVSDDLRRLAGAYMKNERPDQTLQATALVHEAYVRLVYWKIVSWESRTQFFSIAANVMRKDLIDHARARNSQKGSGHKSRS